MAFTFTTGQFAHLGTPPLPPLALLWLLVHMQYTYTVCMQCIVSTVTRCIHMHIAWYRLYTMCMSTVQGTQYSMNT